MEAAPDRAGTTEPAAMAVPTPPRIAVMDSAGEVGEEVRGEKLQAPPKAPVGKLAMPTSGLLAVNSADLDVVLAETYREGVKNPGWDDHAAASTSSKK